MENYPLVSILSPTYNHERYLKDCIESVLSQDYQYWEMILINDGSTDGTANIANSYCNQDPRIRLITQDNVGIFRLSETYNKGLHLAEGKYIAILEGDDCWNPDKLSKQVAALEQNPEAILCWSMANCVNSDRSEVYYTAPDLGASDSIYYPNDPIGKIFNIFLFRNCIPALTILVKRESVLEVGGFQQVFNLPLVDLPTLYELALKGSFVFLPEVLGDWRNYANQVTKTYPAVMTEGFYRLAGHYLRRTEVANLVEITWEQLDQYYSHRMVIAYARSGRYRLIRKEFKEARGDYRKAIFQFGFIEWAWKLRALTGWVLSLFHLDVEGLAKILGKRSYSKH
ncbi:MAG: glycosyltransferase [Marinilabiliales bacterium]|nr:glycosyltransferase [Marinilabiliales bacterium]